MTDFPERERRAKPRVQEPFPVTVRGVDATGARLDIDTALDNVSGGGLYVRIPRLIQPGAELVVGIRLSGPGAWQSTARVATRGVVLRVDAKPNREHGVAVTFTRYRVF